MKYSVSRVIIHIVMAMLICLPAALPLPVMAADKPVAVIGGGSYGRFDSDRFIQRLLADGDIAWEAKDESLDPADFGRYSLVVWFHGFSKKWDERQISDFKAWLENGGRFLHTEGGFYTSAIERKDIKKYPWLGVKTWNYHSKEKVTGQFLQPQHPYLKGIDTEGKYNWLSAWYSLTPEGNSLNLIGNGDKSLLTVTPVGKGEIVWFWNGLFRVREDRASAPAMERILRNIIEAARPLEVAEEIREKVPALSGKGDALLAWKRDWSGASQSDYIFQPAWPLPEESFKECNFYSAMGEIDTQFFLCQSLKAQQVKVELSPLQQVGSGKAYNGHIKVFISERPPLVPSLVRKGQEDLPGKLGRFMLTPVGGTLAINSWRPRVIWLELKTAGLPAGEYASRLSLSGSEGSKLDIPVKARVYPVQMPAKRLVELRYWGGGMPTREPFLSELQRQGCGQINISYPDISKIKLKATGQSLQEAIKKNPAVLGAEPFPALDFRGAYDEALLAGLEKGCHHILLRDVRTGFWVAQAGTGLKLKYEDSAEAWPESFQRLYTAYYRELYNYLTERGFADVDSFWMDEPVVEEIVKTYIPRARLHAAAGLGSGATWTAGGFLTPEQLNTFSPYTTSWSMYTITMPNFIKFWKEGSAKFHPRAKAGTTRGGTGLHLRNAYNISRNLGWTLVYYGQPANFLFTGPLWKGWLYYVDFDAEGNRPQGVEGERLLAYGSADPNDGRVPLLSSSDWEGARDGVDDAALVRMLEWYVRELTPLAKGNKPLAAALQAIEADRGTWFKGDSKESFSIEKSHYKVRETAYDYDTVKPPSSSAIELIKKRVLDHLQRLAPFAGGTAPSLLWHDWTLAERGKVKAVLLLPGTPEGPVKEAMAALQAQCRSLIGRELPLSVKRDPALITLMAGISAEKAVGDILARHNWQADDKYPGPGGYVIKFDKKEKLILITGPDAAGVALGIKNFAAFLEGRGHWLARP